MARNVEDDCHAGSGSLCYGGSDKCVLLFPLGLRSTECLLSDLANWCTQYATTWLVVLSMYLCIGGFHKLDVGSFLYSSLATALWCAHRLWLAT